MPTIHQIREDLHDQLCDALGSWEIFWLIESESDFRKAHLNTLNEFLGFFASTRQAHDTNFLIRLAAIHDTAGSDCMTLQKLLNKLVFEKIQPHHTSKVTLKEIQTQLDALKPIAKSVYEFRSNHIAHRLTKIFSQTQPKGYFTYDQSKELLDASFEVFNAISCYIDGNVYFPMLRAKHDTQRVIESLSKAEPDDESI